MLRAGVPSGQPFGNQLGESTVIPVLPLGTVAFARLPPLGNKFAPDLGQWLVARRPLRLEEGLYALLAVQCAWRDGVVRFFRWKRVPKHGFIPFVSGF